MPRPGRESQSRFYEQVTLVKGFSLFLSSYDPGAAAWDFRDEVLRRLFHGQ
jgi:hypothetical protein